MDEDTDAIPRQGHVLYSAVQEEDGLAGPLLITDNLCVRGRAKFGPDMPGGHDIVTY